MIRSSSSTWSVLRSPQSATATQLGLTVFGAQPRYGVQIELNAERLPNPRGDRSAVLVETIASDPLADRLGLSGRENGLAGGALQRSLQTTDLNDVSPAVAPDDAEVRRVPSPPPFMLEVDCDRLRGQHGARIREATQRHEIPFKRAFVLRQPGREGLESGHVRAPAQWNAPQIALHLENDSVRNPRTF
jgi:hypothetical protein